MKNKTLLTLGLLPLLLTSCSGSKTYDVSKPTFTDFGEEINQTEYLSYWQEVNDYHSSFAEIYPSNADQRYEKLTTGEYKGDSVYSYYLEETKFLSSENYSSYLTDKLYMYDEAFANGVVETRLQDINQTRYGYFEPTTDNKGISTICIAEASFYTVQERALSAYQMDTYYYGAQYGSGTMNNAHPSALEYYYYQVFLLAGIGFKYYHKDNTTTIKFEFDATQILSEGKMVAKVEDTIQFSKDEVSKSITIKEYRSVDSTLSYDGETYQKTSGYFPSYAAYPVYLTKGESCHVTLQLAVDVTYRYEKFNEIEKIDLSNYAEI